MTIPKEFQFDWETLDVLVGGRSTIDSNESLNVSTLDGATDFLQSYGFDLERPIEKAELLGNFHEALSFMRKYFLFPENPEGLRIDLPRKLLELTDPAQLLLWSTGQGAAGPGNTEPTLSGFIDKTPTDEPRRRSQDLRLWSCATLKVMHTISHMDKDLRSPYFSDIQKQILDRIYRVIENQEGRLSLGRTKDFTKTGSHFVPLVSFETKPKKSRESLLIKLLHKPENVAEDVFDRIGIRFVTHNRFDALRVIKFLKDAYVIMPANSKPSRSRNALIDVENFKTELTAIRTEGLSDVEMIYERLVKACDKNMSADSVTNPYSSKTYKAIQFTCRQLVKIANPLYDDLRKVKSLIKTETLSDEGRKLLDNLDFQSIQREIRFFYPFEVQVCDEKSYRESIEGMSSHTAYKNAQVQAAMKRVMKGFMT